MQRKNGQTVEVAAETIRFVVRALRKLSARKPTASGPYRRKLRAKAKELKKMLTALGVQRPAVATKARSDRGTLRQLIKANVPQLIERGFETTPELRDAIFPILKPALSQHDLSLDGKRDVVWHRVLRTTLWAMKAEGWLGQDVDGKWFNTGAPPESLAPKPADPSFGEQLMKIIKGGGVVTKTTMRAGLRKAGFQNPEYRMSQLLAKWGKDGLVNRVGIGTYEIVAAEGELTGAEKAVLQAVAENGRIAGDLITPTANEEGLFDSEVVQKAFEKLNSKGYFSTDYNDGWKSYSLSSKGIEIWSKVNEN